MLALALITTLLLILGTALFFGYTYYFQVQAKADEWMLVLRNGQVVKAGIGISYTRYLNDQVITFPSRIQQVKFSAQQITKENQGIEVSGVIIWTIFRDGDGPFKAYNNLGADLKKPIPTYANSTFKEMINSIVRHRIANSTINEIVTKRDEVRSEIKKQMNHQLNKWGVWLESVEITDVRVLSSRLFSNMQVEFREEMRKKAEEIELKTQQEIDEQKREMQQLNDQKKLEVQTRVEIRKLEERLKVKNQNQKFQEKEYEFKKQNIDAQNELQRYQKSKDHELNVYQINLNKETILQEENNKIEFEKKQDELELQRLAQQKEYTKQRLEQEQLEHEQKLRHIKEEGELNNELQQSLKFDSQVLNAVKDIYSSLPINNVQMVNYGQSGNDPVFDLVRKVATSIKDYSKEQFIIK